MTDACLNLGFCWANTRQRLLDAGNSSWLLRKTVVRFVTAPLALISFSLFAAAIMPWNENFVHTSGPNKGDWQDLLPIAPLALAFVYNFFTTLYVLWNAQPVHSVLEGIIDFLIWAVLIPGVVLSAWGGAFNLWQAPTSEENGMVICDLGMNMLSKMCFPQLYQIGELELAGIVFAIPVWIMQTFLFIHGRLEVCSRPRRVKRQDAAKTLNEMESGTSAGPAWTNFSRVPTPATRLNNAPSMPRTQYR